MNIEQRLTELRAARTLLRRRKKKLSSKIKKRSRDAAAYQICSELISLAAQITQKGVKKILEESISSAMMAVYDDKDVSFELELAVKSKRLNALPWVVEGEDKYSPEGERGGGLLELLSFAMRVVLWSLKDVQSRPIFILDEPLKFVGDPEMLQKAAKILHSIHKNLGIQIIVVTHVTEFAVIAHKGYRVKQKNRVSRAKVLKGHYNAQ